MFLNTWGNQTGYRNVWRLYLAKSREGGKFLLSDSRKSNWPSEVDPGLRQDLLQFRSPTTLSSLFPVHHPYILQKETRYCSIYSVYGDDNPHLVFLLMTSTYANNIPTLMEMLFQPKVSFPLTLSFKSFQFFKPHSFMQSSLTTPNSNDNFIFELRCVFSSSLCLLLLCMHFFAHYSCVSGASHSPLSGQHRCLHCSWPRTLSPSD